MKKILVVVCLFVTGITANAQFYIGGSAGLDIKSTSYESGSESSTVIKFDVYPELGYFVTNRLSFGGEVGFGIASYSSSSDVEINFRFNPYVRYSILQAGKFDVLMKGSLNPEFRKNYTYFGIHIDPILAYNLSEHIMLQANLKFLTFRTFYESNKDKDSTVGFKLGVDANNLATLGSLTFGFIYKF
jgi:hypothetical protein